MRGGEEGVEEPGRDQRRGTPGESASPYRASERQPIFNTPPIVNWVLAVLAGVHLLRLFLSTRSDNAVLQALAFVPSRLTAAVETGADLPGALLTLVTHALLHADILHLAVNGVWCLAFGAFLARRLSGFGFLLFFAVCALGGAAAHYASDPASAIMVVGASGAISGLMGGAARLMFVRGITLHPNGTAYPSVAPLTDPQVLGFAAIWTLINILFGVSGGFGMAGQDVLIAWQAHLGGFFMGLLLVPAFLVPIGRRV